MEGVVLQSYGAGNIPDSRSDIVEELSAATERGVIIVNCSQCFSGYVSDKYAAGLVRGTCISTSWYVKMYVHVHKLFQQH